MRARWMVGLAAAVVAIGTLVLLRHEIVRAAIVVGARVAGYDVRLGDLRIAGDRVVAYDASAARNGVPLIAVRRLEIRYSLRDLLPGSRHRFGLLGVDVDGAHATVERFADGTFNFTAPTARPLPITPPERPSHNRVPLNFTARIADSSVALIEPSESDPQARTIRISEVEARAQIDTATRTHYTASGAFAGLSPEPFRLRGTIDAERGFAMHRAQAPRFPLRALANYFTNTPAIEILGGDARDFDGRLYALDAAADGAMQYHANLKVRIDGASLALQTLAEPVRDLTGELQLVDDTVFVRHMHADLSGVHLHLTGGLFDLLGAATGAPQLRLGIYGDGDIARLRNAFTFTRDQPLAGHLALGVLVEGPLDDPSIVARADAPRASYRSIPFDALHAKVVYRNAVVGLLPLQARYHTTAIVVRGALTTGKVLQTDVAVHVAGSAAHLPFLDRLLGDEPIVADAVAHGEDTRFRVEGAAGSARGIDRVAALFAMLPNGRTAISPFWLHTQRGEFDGGYLLDRPRGDSAFWALASGVRIATPADLDFTGLSLPAIPPIDGRLDRIAVAGGGSGNHIALAGDLRGRDTTISGVRFDRLAAGFGGTLAGARIGLLQASGPWGDFSGRGEFSGQALAAAGDYRGTLEGLQPFLTSAIPAHGPVAGHAAVELQGSRIVIQATDLAMPGATLHGIPVSRAGLTLAVDGSHLRVYSARARAAGGDVVAAGAFSLAAHPAPGSAPLSLIVDRLDAADLRSLGLPLDSGRLWASGDLRAGSPLPGFDGGVTLTGGTFGHFRVSGGGEVRLAGDTAGLEHVVGSLGPAYGLVRGKIGAITSGSPSYALVATVPAAALEGTLNALDIRPPYPMDGTFNGRFSLEGRGAAPSVSGPVGVPAGMLNGLPFTDAGAYLEASGAHLGAREGRVQVGSTGLTFDAAASNAQTSGRVAAPHATLEDFDNFFDTGDTLGGAGSLAIGASLYGAKLRTDGRLDLHGLRYRNVPIGTTAGAWTSGDDGVRGRIAISGEHGAMYADGTVRIATAPNPRAIVRRSRFDVTGAVDRFDLSFWLPVLGLRGIPVTGLGSVHATLQGIYPAWNFRADAALTEGTIGPLQLDTARASLRSAGARIAIDSANVESPGISATAGGTFGLRHDDPIDVSVHAASHDVARLVHNIAGVTIPLKGSFESTLRVGGVTHAPTFTAGIDGTGVTAYGVPIDSLFGEIRLHGKTLELSNAGATFGKGEATLAGFVPLRLSPLQLGKRNEPVSFDADITDLDPAIFNDLFGNGTKLGGTINGHVGLSGTIGNPVIVGFAALANGSYVSDLQREPITQARARLRFDRTSATFDDAYARAGGGTIQGKGQLAFANGFGAGSGSLLEATATAKSARFDFPALGNGTLDADLALTKTAASTAQLSGSATLSAATLALSAFLQAGNGGAAPPPLPLAFDLNAATGRGVRVRGRGYGASLDIGLSGGLHVGGTLAAPLLTGAISAAGGTITYFDRAFRVQEGTASFDGTGVTPTLHAIATTTVFAPDLGTRNGSVGITLTAQGQIDSMDVQFATNPPGFSTNQILAMLAPFGGLIDYNVAGQQGLRTPGGLTPVGPLPGVYASGTNSVTVGREAFNLINASFGSALFSPIETALGESLGLSSINLTLGYYGELGLSASRRLGENFTTIYSASFGQPQLYSFGLRFAPNSATSATLTFFYQTGPTKLLEQPIYTIGSTGLGASAWPLLGGTGFDFAFRRYF